jgi:hypothetical protein
MFCVEPPIVDAEVTPFQSWNARLQEELEYLMAQPATDETIEKIGALVDYAFSDTSLFNHRNHDIQISRSGDGGLDIVVQLDYDDPADYYDDFEIAHDEDFMMLLGSDLMFLDDDNDLSFEVTFDYDLPEIVKQAQEAINAAMLREIEEIARIEQQMWQERVEAMAEADDERKFEKWECHAKDIFFTMHDGPDETQIPEDGTPIISTTESPDDILFAPIPKKQEKTSENKDPSVCDDFCCG